MALWITDDTLTLDIANRAVATARVGEHAAADGDGAWIASTYRLGCSGPNQAKTA